MALLRDLLFIVLAHIMNRHTSAPIRHAVASLQQVLNGGEVGQC